MLVFSDLKEQDGGVYTCVANVGSQVLTTSLDLSSYRTYTLCTVHRRVFLVVIVVKTR